MKVYKLGFTGTRIGLTKPQLNTLRSLLTNLKKCGDSAEFHQGDCIGADALAAAEAASLGWKIVSHPPTDAKVRAFTLAAEIRPEYDYITRNHNIVNETRRMLACPKSFDEELRSGTWATIRYANKMNVPCVIIMPDGTVRAREDLIHMLLKIEEGLSDPRLPAIRR